LPALESTCDSFADKAQRVAQKTDQYATEIG